MAKSKAKSKKTKTKSAKKPVRRATKPKPAKAKKTKKAAAKRPTPKAKAAKKKKKTIGEGSYEAARAFDKDQTAFVTHNSAKIPAMGKAAEAALDGPQGDGLRAAEAVAAGRSRDNF